MTYFAKLTTTGAALLAAASSGSPVLLHDMVIGDANGTAYTPTGSETALKNTLSTQTISSAAVDSIETNVIDVTAVFPASVGGFTAREVGIRTTAGALFAIANLPDTIKPDPSSGAAVDFLITLKMTFSGAANITADIDASAVYITANDLRAGLDFYAVVSATTLAPPGSPVIGAFYLIPPSATGAWATHDNQITAWRGSTAGWQFITPPTAAEVSTADTQLEYRHLGDGTWAVIQANPLNMFVWASQGI